MSFRAAQIVCIEITEVSNVDKSTLLVSLVRRMETYMVILVPVTGLTSTRSTQITLRSPGIQENTFYTEHWTSMHKHKICKEANRLLGYYMQLPSFLMVMELRDMLQDMSHRNNMREKSNFMKNIRNKEM